MVLNPRLSSMHQDINISYFRSSPLRPNPQAANRGSAGVRNRKRSRETDNDGPSSSAIPPSSCMFHRKWTLALRPDQTQYRHRLLPCFPWKTTRMTMTSIPMKI